jgi:hypothetical protein
VKTSELKKQYVSVVRARRIHGENSPVAFEELLSVVTKEANSSDSEEAFALAGELKDKFLALTAADQQYFALSLIQTALSSASKDNFQLCALFYVPVLESAELAAWQNVDEIAASLMNLAGCFHRKKRFMESEKILSTAYEAYKTSQSLPREFVIETAKAHFEVKRYQPVIDIVQRLLDGGDESVGVSALAMLVESYGVLGSRDACEKQLPAIERCLKSVGFGESNDIADLVTGLVRLHIEVDGVMRKATEGMIAGGMNVSQQWSHVLDRLLREIAKEFRKDFESAMRSWFDVCKKQYGANSPEYVRALSHVVRSIIQRRPVVRSEAIVAEALASVQDIQNNAHRELLLELIDKLGEISKHGLDRLVDDVIRDMPVDPIAPMLFVRAADFFRGRDLQKTKSLQRRAIMMLVEIIPADDQWFKPFIELIADSQDKFEGHQDVENFVLGFSRELSSTHTGRDLEARVLETLSRCCKDATVDFLRTKLAKLGLEQSDETAHKIQMYMMMYVNHSTNVDGINRNSIDEPDLSYVARAYTYLLPGVLLSNWKRTVGGANQACKVSFEMTDTRIDHIAVIESSGSAGCDSEVVSAMHRASEQRKFCVGINGLKFVAVFDFAKSTVVVESRTTQ